MYHKCHYAPVLGTTRLKSPQLCFKVHDKNRKFIVQWNKSQIELESGDVMALGMHPETFPSHI